MGKEEKEWILSRQKNLLSHPRPTFTPQNVNHWECGLSPRSPAPSPVREAHLPVQLCPPPHAPEPSVSPLLLVRFHTHPSTCISLLEVGGVRELTLPVPRGRQRGTDSTAPSPLIRAELRCDMGCLQSPHYGIKPKLASVGFCLRTHLAWLLPSLVPLPHSHGGFSWKHFIAKSLLHESSRSASWGTQLCTL